MSAYGRKQTLDRRPSMAWLSKDALVQFMVFPPLGLIPQFCLNPTPTRPAWCRHFRASVILAPYVWHQTPRPRE